MKTTELQINDWVMYEGKPRRITGLDENSVYFEKGCTECHKVTKIIPIPLTADILEKNGFVASNNFADILGIEIYGNEEKQCGVEPGDGEDDWDFKIYEPWTRCYEDGSPEDWGYLYTTNIKGIKYVHELQHALKLCHIEKEIVV